MGDFARELRQPIKIETEPIGTVQSADLFEEDRGSRRVGRDSPWLSLADLDAGGGEFDQAFDNVGIRAGSLFGMPKRFPKLMRFPIKPGVEQCRSLQQHTPAVAGRIRERRRRSGTRRGSWPDAARNKGERRQGFRVAHATILQRLTRFARLIPLSQVLDRDSTLARQTSKRVERGH